MGTDKTASDHVCYSRQDVERDTQNDPELPPHISKRTKKTCRRQKRTEILVVNKSVRELLPIKPVKVGW